MTFYDDATGERIELSVATYANWVAKTAGLAQDELDAERGGLVLVDLPTHWLGAVWLGAAWSLGLTVTDDPALADEADLVAKIIARGVEPLVTYERNTKSPGGGAKESLAFRRNRVSPRRGSTSFAAFVPGAHDPGYTMPPLTGLMLATSPAPAAGNVHSPVENLRPRAIYIRTV